MITILLLLCWDDVKLQGNWKAMSYTEDGEKATRLEKTPITWHFDKQHFTIKAHDQQESQLSGSYVLNDNKSPATIDMDLKQQASLPAQKLLGIVKLEKDQLVICYSTGGQRPKAFESKPGSNAILIVFDKAK